MVEKVRYLKFQAPNSPLTFYPNHFSFLQTSEAHGAFTSKKNPLWRDDDLIGRGDPQYADVRAIVDPKVYASDTRPLFLNQSLVSPTMKALEEFSRVGRYVPLRLFNRTFKIYIWRRSYIRLQGWQTRAAMDYAYDYVM